MPECPICGSSQLVPVLHGRQRTSGSLALAGTAVDEWVCGDCGRRWRADQLAAAEANLIPFPRAEVDPDALPQLEEMGSPEAAPEPPASVGGRLRAARKERGLSVEEVAEATGIWPRHLRALEEDEPLEAFPGAAYARLYLRDYATFLGLDPEPLLREHRARHRTEDEEPALAPLPDPRARIRRISRALSALSATALVAIMLAPQIRLGGGREPSPQPPPLGTRAATTSAPLAHEPRRPAAPVDRLRVVLEMREPCWIGASVDGERTVSRTAAPGERIVLRGRRVVELVLGNGGGVILRVNGERVPTGAHGEVVRLTFHLRDGAVRIDRA